VVIAGSLAWIDRSRRSVRAGPEPETGCEHSVAEEPETADADRRGGAAAGRSDGDVDLADESPSSRIYRYIMRSQSDADGVRRPLASTAPVERSEAR
jgi:hypothetical protein